MQYLTASDAPLWLLDLDLGGRVYHVAESILEVDGVTYTSGLEPLSLSDAGDLLDQLDLSIDIGVDWAHLVLVDGIQVELGTATIRRYWPSHDHVETVLTGEVREPEYGAAHEPLTITVVRQQPRAIPLLSGAATVSAVTWPENHLILSVNSHTHDERQEGQQYPLIFGKPGWAALAGSYQMEITAGATPGLIVSRRWTDDDVPSIDSMRILIADGAVAATEVMVYVHGVWHRQAARPVEVRRDAQGRTVSTVRVSASGAEGGFEATGQTPEIWIGWGVSEGGVTDGDKLIRGAGDVIEWILRRGQHRIDWGRMAASLPVLNRYLVDTFVNQPGISGWDWLTTTLFPHLPVAVLESDEGIYLKVIRWEAEPHEAVAHLATYEDPGEGLMVERTGRLLASKQEIHNEIEVLFAKRFGVTWGNRVWATSTPGVLSDGSVDARAIWHPRCAESHAAFGHRVRPEPIELTWVHDTSTAVRIARDMAARFALPMRSVSYKGGWDLERLQPWDVVTVTDPEVSLYRRVCLISERTITAEGIELTLFILPQVAQTRPVQSPYVPPHVDVIDDGEDPPEPLTSYGDIPSGGVWGGDIPSGGV